LYLFLIDATLHIGKMGNHPNIVIPLYWWYFPIIFVFLAIFMLKKAQNSGRAGNIEGFQRNVFFAFVLLIMALGILIGHFVSF
jgi:hypothetical protein